MFIQHIRLPKPGCPDGRLYVRGEGDFGTFFNMLSLDKWKGYTDVGKISLSLDLAHDCEVVLELHGHGKNDSLRAGAGKGRFEIPLPDDWVSGCVCLRIEGGDRGTVVSGGFTADDPGECARLALDMCTFKREGYVSRKISDLMDSFSEFGGRYADSVELFVADNGGTYVPDVEDPRVHIFRNPNTGGSGGFARGKKEAEAVGGFTHIVFMDDDTVVDFESIYRMWAFASYLGDRREGTAIGGAMLRMDRPWEVHESDALVTGRNIVFNKHALDVSDLAGCLEFDRVEDANYNGWWLCCYPMLPLSPAPFFIMWDDAEYGVRSGCAIVPVNGVSAWHEPFDTKYSPAKLYYRTRNRLAMLAMNGMFSAEAYRSVLRKCITEAFCYRYDNAELMIRAVEDFRRGPEWLSALDPEAFNGEISSLGNRAVPCGELDIPFDEEGYEASLNGGGCRTGTFARRITLNGLLLPVKREYVVAPMEGRRSEMFYRARKALNCTPDGKTGFVTERDRARCLRILCRITAMMFSPAHVKDLGERYSAFAETLSRRFGPSRRPGRKGRRPS